MLSRTAVSKYLSEHVFNGFLFVGDPHETSRTPTNRTDSLVFKFVCSKKLAEAVSIANKENLLLVILGDLFDREDDYEAGSMVANTLSLYDHTAIVLGGNHDKKTDILAADEIDEFKKISSDESNIDSFIEFLSGITDPDDGVDTKLYSDIVKTQSRSAIYLLRSARLINLIETTGYVGSIKTVSGVDYNLFGCPYGDPIPTSLNCALSGRNFLITHHDLDFGVGLVYRDSDKLYPIEDCYMAINGHIHDFKKMLKVGETIWFNPGNIVRLSKDMEGHVPSVFAHTEASVEDNFEDTGCANMKRFILQYKAKVFRTNEALDKIEKEIRENHRNNVHGANFVSKLKLMLVNDQKIGDNDSKIASMISEMPDSTEKSILEDIHRRVELKAKQA